MDRNSLNNRIRAVEPQPCIWGQDESRRTAQTTSLTIRSSGIPTTNSSYESTTTLWSVGGVSTSENPDSRPYTPNTEIASSIESGHESSSLSSPSLESYQVRNIPLHSLPQLIKWPLWMQQQPLWFVLECHRLKMAGFPIEDHFEELKSHRALQSLYQFVEEKSKGSLFSLKSFQKGFKTNFADATLAARLRWSRRYRESVFQFEMLPARKEPTCSVYRHFGGARFLALEIPSLSMIPSEMGLGDQEPYVRKRVLEFLRQELQVLGCKWKFVHLKEIKGKRKANDDYSNPGSCKAIFFATSRDHSKLRPITVRSVIDWAVPLRENKNQLWCKAGSRLDLVFSSTTKGITLKPNEIQKVDDLKSIDISDRSVYDDRTIPGSAFERPADASERDVVNDGCNLISFELMQRLRKQLNWPFNPCAIQVRVFGAKGILFLASDDVADGSYIRLSDSQIKVRQKAENYTSRFDADCLTMNIVKYVLPIISSSVLYLDYCPILLDRGVSAETLCEIARAHVKRETLALIESVKDSPKLRQWIHSRNFMGDEVRDVDVSGPGRTKLTDSRKIALMLDAGFTPTSCRHLRNMILSLAQRAFAVNKQNLKISVPRSVMAIGVADPFGCLKSNEIFLSFSESFCDENTGERRRFLDGVDVLVSRNPALRASDIQKVRAVFRQELKYLCDIVIFSTQVSRPLAGKLQGGDYDGDTFWVCWEPEVVQSFKNAPAPWSLPCPKRFGITVEKQTLEEFLQMNDRSEFTDAAVENWTISLAKRRMSYSLLGEITRLREKLIYAENGIRSAAATSLADLHDLLVDADKQGYTFDRRAWNAFKREFNIPSALEEPAYREHLASKQKEDGTTYVRHPVLGNGNNILDCVVLRTYQPAIDHGLAEVKRAMGDSQEHDQDLARPYEERVEMHKSYAPVASELKGLRTKLDSFKKHCEIASRKYHADMMTWNEVVDDCLANFDAISPDNEDDAVIKDWTSRGGYGPSDWDLLKASAAAKFYRNNEMIFKLLYQEFCIIKSRSQGKSFEISQAAYVDLKPRGKQRAESNDIQDIADSDEESDYGDSDGFSQFGDD